VPTTTEAAGTSEGLAFALFETPIGCCAIAWRGDKVVATALPEDDRERLRSRFRGAEERRPPPQIEAVMGAIRRLLEGEREDLSSVTIDLTASSEFERQVYAAAIAIPAGETLTYGELARRIGMPDAARAVGHALGRNPLPIIVPCHRILASAGGSGGFSAPGGAATKLRMLEIEGARRDSDGGLFEHLPWSMKPRAS